MIEKVKISAEAFIETVNSSYKGASVLQLGSNFRALNLARFSSGILSLDVALGGGWPFSKVCVIAGEYSTGKTLLALKAIAAVEEYDHVTKKHKEYCDDDKFFKGRSLFVDSEGTLDIKWAIANGFDENHHVVARPEYSEQAIDIVTAAIQEDCFDLIVVDSIAAMTPSVEITESTEDWQMGLAARLNNKAFRRWNSSLNKMSQENNVGGACVLCLNQFRMKIGLSFGDPRVLPGGKGQEFNSVIIVYTKSQKYDDTESKELGEVVLRGVVHKNKTYIPKQNFGFKLVLRTDDDVNKGTVDNVAQLLDLGRKHKLIVQRGGKTCFGKLETPTQKAFKERVAVSPVTQRQLWKSIVKAATDYTL